MSNPGLILVDTSVWIQFFRHAQSSQAQALDGILSAGSAATCAPIRAEVISGAPTKHEFQRLCSLFKALTFLDPPAQIWNRIEEHFRKERGHAVRLNHPIIQMTTTCSE